MPQQEAIDGKTITEADIDITLTRLFTYRQANCLYSQSDCLAIYKQLSCKNNWSIVTC